MAYAVEILMGGWILYWILREIWWFVCQLYRQKVGWTKSLKEKLDAATRSRISDLLSTDDG